MTPPAPLPALTLKVRNVLGVRKADVQLRGITLVGGVNGAGKSSLLEAAACAALRSPLARGQGTKKAAAALLHKGSEAGTATLDWGNGSQRVTWPDCSVEEAGRGVDFGTALGIGSARLMALPSDQRVQQVTERFGLAPGLLDMTSWFTARPDAGLDADAMDELWDRIEASGWDAVLKAAKEMGSKLKGRWEQATGVRYGEQKARTWCPQVLLPGEEYDLDQARQAVADAKAEVENLVRRQAEAGVDRKKLEAEAATLQGLQLREDGLRGDRGAIDRQIDKLTSERGSKDAPVDTSLCPACPHCGKAVRLVKGQYDYVTLAKAPAPLPPEALKDARLKIADLEGRIQHARNALEQNARDMAEVGRGLQAAERARQELARLAAIPPFDEAKLIAARDLVMELDRKADAIKALQTARGIAAEVAQHLHIVEALEPEGVRRAVLARRLAEINTRLSELCTTAGFGEVALTEEMDATMDGRPFSLLSESERWRVDLVLTVELGRAEGARLILVDRLDVLHPQARVGPIKLLAKLGIPALVGMTAKDRDALPALSKAKLGTERWLEGGVLHQGTDNQKEAA